MSQRCASDLNLQHYHRKYLRVSYVKRLSKVPDMTLRLATCQIRKRLGGFAADLEALELAGDIQSDASLGHKIRHGSPGVFLLHIREVLKATSSAEYE
ncbi:hypothetical protein EMPG_17017 [Blastomyces silverae]|uniref:Uncharacterized protein n=1 Tax=Blastomyces silverae TaxID=2060906 RepID=A0A0H1BE66_9EURO|nr:hypothetical protein EMPG_17017 [Blastomyces silverae]